MNTSESQGTTAFRLGVIAIAAIGLLVAGVLYLANGVSKGLETLSRDLADSLAGMQFKNIERFPQRAFVLYQDDTVATVEAGSEWSTGGSTKSLLLLGRWTETDRALLVRRRPTLTGLVQLSRDSASLFVQIHNGPRTDTGPVRGYLLLAPDSRWVTLH